MVDLSHQRIAESQVPLPLGDAPGDEISLRDAFARSGLAKLGWTFERAIRVDVIRKCLINIKTARLHALAQKEARP